MDELVKERARVGYLESKNSALRELLGRVMERSYVPENTALAADIRQSLAKRPKSD